MSTFTKKIAVGFLTATTVLSLSGFGAAVLPVANAQTTAELQAIINGLIAQIAALQAQLTGSTGGGTGVAVACSFTRSLTIGATGADAQCLQKYLNASGFTVAASGVGSPGNETTYFGSLTRAAVAKWQAANGVSPAVGYFGPISIAKYNSLGPVVTPPGGTTPPVVTPTGNVQVTLAIGSGTGAAIAGAGQVNTGRFAVTAPSTSGITVSSMTFTKVGVLSDSNISNLYLADASTGEVVAQYQSLTNGVATFAGLSLNVPAGTTRTFELRMDLSSSATAGNTIAWQLTSVGTATNHAVSGLPVSTNTLTVTTVSNPSIATLTLDDGAVAASVDAGTNNVQVALWTATVGNSDVRLNNMQVTFVGSANPSDIRNLRLLVNGTEVATLPQAALQMNFHVPGGIMLDTGASTIQIFADVMGSPNRTMQFDVLQPFHLSAVDTEYNTGISITNTNDTSNSISINSGSIVVQVASDSPSTPIPAGASSVTLGKFTIFAAGEAVKVKNLDVTFTDSSSSDWDTVAGITDDLSNIRIVDDAGGQVGSTISAVTHGTTSGTCGVTTTAATLFTCHFGVSGSPINYIVPANTTRTLSVQADIGASSNMTTVQTSLPALTSNLEGQTSFQSANSGAATASARSLTAASAILTLSLNSSYSAPTFIAGATQARIASFILTASSAEGANVSTITLEKNDLSAFDIQNLIVKVNGTQFGTTRSTIGDAEASLAFSASNPVMIAAGNSVQVDVYADILTTTTATTHTSPIAFNSWTALGSTSNTALSDPTDVEGQNVTVSSGPTLTLAETGEIPAKYAIMGSTNVELAQFRFTADNVDDIRITDITMKDVIGSGSATNGSFKNLTLWDGSTKVAGPINMSLASAASGSIAFTLTTPVVVQKNGTKILTLKGDVGTFSEGAVSASTHSFRIAGNGDLTAKSVGSASATVTITGAAASANSHTVYRTNLSLSSNVLGASSGRTRKALDDVANLNFTADANHQVLLNSVTLKFQGAAVTSDGTAFAVYLLDGNDNALGSVSNPQTCTPGIGNSCSVTFQPAYTISGGTTKASKIRVVSASFTNGANTADSLSITVNGAGDVTFSDGTTTSINLRSGIAPFEVVTVSYE